MLEEVVQQCGAWALEPDCLGQICTMLVTPANSGKLLHCTFPREAHPYSGNKRTYLEGL